MREIVFETRFFLNLSEWEYFLYQCGIPKEKYSNIDEVKINVHSHDIEYKEEK